MRRLYGENDGEARRDAKGFSSYPCKHFFRIRESVTNGPVTLKDDGLNASDAALAFSDSVANGLAKATLPDSPLYSNSIYVPNDTESVILIDGGNGSVGTGDAVSFGGSYSSGTAIVLRNQAQTGIKILSMTDTVVGALFSNADEALRFTVLNRDTGVVDIYQTLLDTDEVSENKLYTKSGIAGSFGATTAMFKKSQINGFAMMAFSAGELPSVEQLMPDFNRVNKTWRKPNRMLPSGWTDKYAFAG